MNFINKNSLEIINHELIETNKELGVEFSSDPEVSFIDIVDLFCDQDGCLVYLGDDVKAGITSYDYGHFTPIASEYVAEKIRPYFTGTDN
ncbi:SGNH hydrolase domain-containing protein [Gammaproteobacteria bacterium]|nr:SGNH hydrolase domain-containing protein [Gammaproteobacteria bacterium]